MPRPPSRHSSLLPGHSCTQITHELAVLTSLTTGTSTRCQPSGSRDVPAPRSARKRDDGGGGPTCCWRDDTRAPAGSPSTSIPTPRGWGCHPRPHSRQPRHPGTWAEAPGGCQSRKNRRFPLCLMPYALCLKCELPLDRAHGLFRVLSKDFLQ